jgi:dihydroorotate dehydrogenase
MPRCAACRRSTAAPAPLSRDDRLSGPAVRPIALQQVRAVAAAVALPLVGMGGICSGADAGEFIAAGARLVAVGTENFRDPRAGARVAAELAGAAPGGRAAVPVLDLE